MKRQFYFDDVERDLIRCALALWKYRLAEREANVSGDGHHYAKHFTLRRIDALMERMEEPKTAEGQS